MLKIGVDIDGVLTDLHNFNLKFGERHFKDKKIVNASGADVSQIFGCSFKELKKFWTRHVFQYASKLPPRDGAKDTIEKLKQEGNEIIIITSRVLSHKKNLLGMLMRFFVKRWLKRHDIQYDKIYFCSEDKSETCIKNGIDVMIEDSIENIKKLSQYFKILCFDAPYNKECDGHNISRVYSFDDVYETITDSI